MGALWTPGDDAILTALMTARLTDEAIGERLERTVISVRSRLTVLRRRGHVFPQRPNDGAPPKHNPALDQQIIDMMRAGADYDTIGVAIGRTASAVSGYIYQMRKRRDDVPKSARRVRIESAMAPSFEATLRKLWAAGLSAGEIGKRVGITKDAVIGRVHRMGLEPRPSPICPRKEAPPVPAIEHRRLALPAGHPVSWGMLTAGTILEGVAYPCP